MDEDSTSKTTEIAPASTPVVSQRYDQPGEESLGGDGVERMREPVAERPIDSSAIEREIESNRHLVVVYDSLQECPYIEGQVARMPLEYPRHPLSPVDLDELLEQGYRRTGNMLYRTACPLCRECIPVRVDVNQFVMTKSMRRILNRSHRELQVQWGRPQADETRLRLFNLHRDERKLTRSGPVSKSDYHDFLVASCVESAELSFWCKDKLIGIAIVDVGACSLNAVYTHFDPDHSRYSLGTLAVLLQIQYAKQTGRRFVYLGLFVEENKHLNYKERFRPQQRRLDDQWVLVDE